MAARVSYPQIFGVKKQKLFKSSERQIRPMGGLKIPEVSTSLCGCLGSLFYLTVNHSSEWKSKGRTKEATPGRLLAGHFHLLKLPLWWGTAGFQHKARMSKLQ